MSTGAPIPSPPFFLAPALQGCWLARRPLTATPGGTAGVPTPSCAPALSTPTPSLRRANALLHARGKCSIPWRLPFQLRPLILRQRRMPLPPSAPHSFPLPNVSPLHASGLWAASAGPRAMEGAERRTSTSTPKRPPESLPAGEPVRRVGMRRGGDGGGSDSVSEIGHHWRLSATPVSVLSCTVYVHGQVLVLKFRYACISI